MVTRRMPVLRRGIEGAPFADSGALSIQMKWLIRKSSNRGGHRGEHTLVADFRRKVEHDKRLHRLANVLVRDDRLRRTSLGAWHPLCAN